MSNKLIKECDICGKQVEKPKEISSSRNDEWTQPEWFRILSINMTYRPKDHFDRTVPFKNQIKITEDKDPDFCCKKCAIAWFKDIIDKLEAGEIGK